MTSPLENMVRQGMLHAERPDAKEYNGLVRSGRVRLQDARKATISLESRFDLAYNAAHALCARRELAEQPDIEYYESMTKVEKLEHEVAALSADELSEFRRWFTQFDAEAWDQQLERDARSGALDRLAEDALADYRAGRSRPL